MQKFIALLTARGVSVPEWMPWDLEERRRSAPLPLIIDVREPYEFSAMHLAGSLNVPRGILESACEWDHEETVPELVRARQQEVVLVCRSGHRSLLAAYHLSLLGYENAISLRTGLRGWKDYDQPLVDAQGDQVDPEVTDAYFQVRIRPEQRRPDGS